MPNYFHHQIIRNHVIAFGDLFKDIHIKRWNGDTELNSIHVPVAYANKEAFIERVRLRGNDPTNIHDVVDTTVPRFAFEITSLEYDKETKLNRLHKYRMFHDVGLIDSSETLGDLSMDQIEEFTKDRLSMLYSPVPYMLHFSLYALTNKEEDKHHIIELLSPQFTPSLSTTVNYTFGPVLINTGLKYKGRIRAQIDELVTLTNIRSQELNNIDFKGPNLIITQFDFTMRCQFFREIDTMPLIKNFILNFNVSGENIQPPPISLHYYSAPTANNTVVDLESWYQYFVSDMYQDTDDITPSRILE